MPFSAMPALALQLARSGQCSPAQRCPGLSREGPDHGLAVSRFSPQFEALRVLGRRGLRQPDSLPFPGLPAGTDTMPAI